MQEQKRYQIEKVIHSKIYEHHSCCVIDYHQNLNENIQLNYFNYNFAKSNKIIYSVGIWRIKQLKTI